MMWLLLALAAIAYAVIVTLALDTAKRKLRKLENENYALRTALGKRDYFDVVTNSSTESKAGG